MMKKSVYWVGIILLHAALGGEVQAQNVPETAQAETGQTAPAAAKETKQDAEQIDFANGLFERGLYPMALLEYEKYVANFADSEFVSDAYFGIAESRFLTRNYAKAVEGYEVYLERFPDGKNHHIAKLRLGQSYFLSDHFPKALEYFQQLNPADFDAHFQQTLHYFWAQTHMALNEMDRALGQLMKATQVLKADLYTANAFLDMGDIYLAQDKTQQAVESYVKAFHSASEQEIKSVAVFKQGEAYFSAGKFLEAAKEFENVVEVFSDQPVAAQAFSNLLIALYNAGAYEPAVKAHERYGKPDKEALSNDVIVISSSYAALGRYQDGLAYLEKAGGATDPETKQIISLQKAEILIQSEQYKEALRVLETDLQNNALNGDALYLKAEAYYGLKEYRTAYGLYERVAREFPESEFATDALMNMAHSAYAEERFEEAVDLFLKFADESQDPFKRGQALYNAILTARSLQQFDKAVDISRRYLSEYPDGNLVEEVQFRLGTDYFELKRYQQAVEAMDALLAGFPESEYRAEALFWQGQSYQAADQADKALALYQKVESDEKVSPEILYGALKSSIGIYLAQQNWEAAAASLDKVIARYPNNDLDPSQHLWLAEHYLAQNKFEDVLRVLEPLQARELPGPAKTGVAYFQGMAYHGLQQMEEALKRFDATIAAGPSDYLAPAYLGRGNIHLQTGRMDEARQDFDKAIETSPDDHTISMQARYSIASLEEKREAWEEASKYYMLVGVLYQDATYTPQALFKAGQIFEHLERVDEAVKVYQEVEEKYPDSEEYAPSLERLKVLRENQV